MYNCKPTCWNEPKVGVVLYKLASYICMYVCMLNFRMSLFVHFVVVINHYSFSKSKFLIIPYIPYKQKYRQTLYLAVFSENAVGGILN